MIPLMTFTTPPGPCGYLEDRIWQLHYEIVAEATAAEYGQRLQEGWRRFGRAMFRPRCPSCTSCQSLRVDVAKFQPDRSQRRNARDNNGRLKLAIGRPEISAEKLDLYDRYHAFQVANVGWSDHGPKDPNDYYESFVDNPFPAEEWCYYMDGVLVGVGHVDAVPGALSAIYFFHDPAIRGLGPGTWNVLCSIGEAARRRVPHVYLGYYVAGCRSLEYKARFLPSEALDFTTMTWGPFTG